MPGDVMRHEPTGLEFHILCGNDATDPITKYFAHLRCQPESEEAAYNLGHAALVAFLDHQGTPPGRYWHNIIQGKAAMLPPNLPYAREGTDYLHYDAAEWTFTALEPWPLMRHEPTTCAFLIMHNREKSARNEALDPFTDYAASFRERPKRPGDADYDPLRYSQDAFTRLGRTAILAFLDRNGTPPDQLWRKIYRGLSYDQSTIIDTDAPDVTEWLQLGRITYHTPTGCALEINGTPDKGFTQVREIGNPSLDDASIERLQRTLIAMHRQNLPVNSSIFLLPGANLDSTAIEPSEWEVKIREASGETATYDVSHKPTGLQFWVFRTVKADAPDPFTDCRADIPSVGKSEEPAQRILNLGRLAIVASLKSSEDVSEAAAR
jgi:hypothetical protein